MDCSLSGSSVHGIFQARVHPRFLLQGIFLTQESNPGLPHCRQTLYRLSHQGSPREDSFPLNWKSASFTPVPLYKPYQFTFSYQSKYLKFELSKFSTFYLSLTLSLMVVKSWFIGEDPDAGKDWEQEEKGVTEDEMVGWHHWLNGHEFEQTPGVGDGQGDLACCSPWGRKESDMT